MNFLEKAGLIILLLGMTTWVDARMEFWQTKKGVTLDLICSTLMIIGGACMLLCGGIR
jgi:hypothetical protein